MKIWMIINQYGIIIKKRGIKMTDMQENNSDNGPTESEYKGRPILTLNPGEKYPFSFGLSKAKLILKYIDAIRAFVEKYQ